MKRFLLRSVLAVGLIAGGLATVAPLAAQELPKEGLPRAEDILDREVKVSGGKEARRRVKTIATTMKISAADMQIRLVVYHAGPTKHYKEISSDGLRKTEVVVNGDTAWVNDSITGARLLRGEEKVQAIRDVEAFIKDFRRGSSREEYKQVRTVAEETVAGKAAYRVEMTTTKGETVIAHYDKHSGQMVRQEKDSETPQGKARVIEFHTDHRKVGAFVMPFAGRVVQGPNEYVVTVERIEFNGDIPEERFALPSELKKQQVQP